MDCAKDMEGKDCAKEKDAQVNLRHEDYASGTEGKYHAATKDVQVSLVREECAVGMVHTAIRMTNLLYLIYHVDQHMTKRLQLFLISTLSQCLPTKSETENLLR
mmetsp:Transcript_24530/g.37152  ORF Transcript_24530/g.37152 Transcript_24530/m.37152 type:complete len:104 (-) Transcript_24530:128-439(-)